MSITHFQTTTNGGGGLNLVAHDVGELVVSPSTATVLVQYQRDGDLVAIGDASPFVAADEWSIVKTPTIGNGYEIRADTVDAVSGSATNAWINFPASWQVSRDTVGVTVADLTISVRFKGATNPIDSVAVELRAQVLDPI